MMYEMLIIGKKNMNKEIERVFFSVK